MASGYYIKAVYKKGDPTPIGQCTLWITDTVDDMLNKGWLPCDGKSYDPSDQFDLFMAIGYTHGTKVTSKGSMFCVPYMAGWTNSDGCKHEWVKYIGFTDMYDYCAKCDAKKGFK